jgi:DNA-directed RNA polymerase specialized sigma24 family protein
MSAREQRFESLYREYYGYLMGYAARHVEDGQEADVVAETFTIAWKHLDQLREGDALPWLYGIARRRCGCGHACDRGGAADGAHRHRSVYRDQQRLG